MILRIQGAGLIEFTEQSLKLEKQDILEKLLKALEEHVGFDDPNGVYKSGRFFGNLEIKVIGYEHSQITIKRD